MSKSATRPNSYIALLDDPKVATKKIMRATTDSGNEIKFDLKNKPGISNLMTIYGIFAHQSHKQIENKYKNKGYGDFKKDVADVVSKFLTAFQEKYNNISDKQIENILKNSAKKLNPVAEKKMAEVKKKIGVK